VIVEGVRDVCARGHFSTPDLSESFNEDSALSFLTAAPSALSALPFPDMPPSSSCFVMADELMSGPHEQAVFGSQFPAQQVAARLR
jgi:hypothetical protein